MTYLHNLHPMYTKDVLMPKFVTQFRCIGSECSLSCCTYFNVHFRKKDYDILEKLDLTAEQKKNYKKCSKSTRTDDRYAEFVGRDGSRVCGFLDGGLCALHRDFGEDALPRVCYIYPRLFQILGQQHTELSLYLSCPSVSELALLQEDAFDFFVQTMSFRKDAVTLHNGAFADDPQLILDIRFFCLQVMQVKEIDLWKRVALLGLFCSQLNEIVTNTISMTQKIEEVSQQIHQLIAGATTLIESGEVNTIYDAVEAKPQYLISCISYFVGMTHECERTGGRHFFEQLFRDVYATLSLDGGDLDHGSSYDFSFVLNNYRQGIRHLKNSLKDHPYFFEHILLAELLFLNFPFTNHPMLPMYHYFVFVYIFMRFILAMFCAQGEQTPKELSLVVAKMMRTFQHRNMRYLMDTIDYQSLGWEGNLSAIYAHLKDEI